MINKISFIFCLIYLFSCGNLKDTKNLSISDKYSEHNNSIIWSNDMIPFRKYWVKESERRFENPLIFMGHGFYDSYDNWSVTYLDNESHTIVSIVKNIKNRYPDRDIVLVVCNSRGVEINFDRVWYADQLVWLMPDKNSLIRNAAKDNGIGNIFEFRNDSNGR